MISYIYIGPNFDAKTCLNKTSRERRRISRIVFRLSCRSPCRVTARGLCVRRRGLSTPLNPHGTYFCNTLQLGDHPITLTGSNLDSIANVKVDGAPCRLVPASTTANVTTLSCFLPPGSFAAARFMHKLTLLLLVYACGSAQAQGFAALWWYIA